MVWGKLKNCLKRGLIPFFSYFTLISRGWNNIMMINSVLYFVLFLKYIIIVVHVYINIHVHDWLNKSILLLFYLHLYQGSTYPLAECLPCHVIKLVMMMILKKKQINCEWLNSILLHINHQRYFTLSSFHRNIIWTQWSSFPSDYVMLAHAMLYCNCNHFEYVGKSHTVKYFKWNNVHIPLRQHTYGMNAATQIK